jgi:teichuronic acid biosynthesis glycosyltransferase TuaC
MSASIVIFAEEYVRLTTGMYLVWLNHAGEAAKQRPLDVLLNHEHWAFEATRAAFENNSAVAVRRLPFYMPSTLVKRALAVVDGIWLLRAGRYVFGQALDLVFAPLIMVYLWAWLLYTRPQAVFSHNGGWPAGKLCRWVLIAAKLAGVPRRVFIVHTQPRPHRQLHFLLRPIRSMQAWLMDHCSTSIVTVSDSVKAVLEREVFKRPVVRIYNGISLAPPQQHVAAGDAPPLNWHPSGLVVGFVGGLFPHKGPHVLLDAFQRVEMECELALLGPSDSRSRYLKDLQQQARNCRNKVSFLGYHPDVDSFMERIDVLVVPATEFESFGMVILEAMKHRKPVICSDYGGMKEVIEDGVTGMLVRSGDGAGLAKVIETLLTDPGLRADMGQAGFRRLHELFTLEKMADQYDRLLQ